MGSSSSRLLKDPWRPPGKNINSGILKKYKPSREDVSALRILLVGPVGAGKSSFINSLSTALRSKSANMAATNSAAEKTESFTVKFDTHKFRKDDPENEYYNFVLADTMGLEPSDGVRPEDLKLVMEGHVKEGYRFDPENRLTEDNEGYIDNPSQNDKVHVLVFVLSANSPHIDPSVLRKINKIREAARDLVIPQVLVVTNIDQLCEEVDKDVKNVFRSKTLRSKMKEFSLSVGISINYMFPVKNYTDGKLEEDVDMDELLLSALKHIIDYGDDFLHRL